MSIFKEQDKLIYLGTAMWGWSVPKYICFSLLDFFYQNGGRYVDTAKNYPINGDGTLFMFAEKTLSEWLKVNGINDLCVNAKIGAISNKKISNNDLSKEFISSEHARLRDLFSANLHTMMIHWDNRDEESKVIETLETLESIEDVLIGISGIKNLEIYLEAFTKINFKNPCTLQLKYNFLHKNLYDYYLPLSKYVSIRIAYGIGLSGIKLAKSEYKKDSYVSLSKNKGYHDNLLNHVVTSKINYLICKAKNISNVYDLAIIFSMLSKDIDGFIIAPSKLEQITSIKKTLIYLKESQWSIGDFEF